jgi:hypothetical protein
MVKDGQQSDRRLAKETEARRMSVRARRIEDDDVPAVVDLLARGFPRRPRKFWSGMLAALTDRAVPEGYPRYGYLLESDGAAVGALLLIFSCMCSREGSMLRCNVSSWYVEPRFRSYGSMLVAKALSHKDATYLNVTPAPHTLPILTAQGYSQYCGGTFVALPVLQRGSGRAQIKVVTAGAPAPESGDAFEHQLLLDHARYGCVSLWCEADDRAHPFVLRPRLIRGVVPCAQLVYCRDVEDFIRFAGPIGRFLARRGRFVVLVDANGDTPGLIGRYFDGKIPKFFRGPHLPRLGDLAYTETALFGV